MRQAIIEMAPECVAEIGPLLDHGLFVVCSLGRCPGQHQDLVRLVIQGDLLPEACEVEAGKPTPTVLVTFAVEAYGRQRMTKVMDVRVIEFVRGAA